MLIGLGFRSEGKRMKEQKMCIDIYKWFFINKMDMKY